MMDVNAYVKPCYGLCERCVWKGNGGCSEWNDYGNCNKEVKGTSKSSKEKADFKTGDLS